MKSKQRLALWLIVVAVAIVLVLKLILVRSPSAVDSNAMRSKGPASAKVQIIEFIDMQCPSCAKGSQLLKDYMSKHPGDIRVQIKYFPLTKAHSHAKPSALYAECAARQGKFWPFVDTMLEHQQQWAPLPSADPIFLMMAKDAGADVGQLKACLTSPDALKTIENDQSLGQSLGISSTPTYFINNKMVVGSKSLIDELNTYFP